MSTTAAIGTSRSASTRRVKCGSPKCIGFPVDEPPVEEPADRNASRRALPQPPRRVRSRLARHVDAVPSQHGILADHADVHDHCVAFHLGRPAAGTRHRIARLPVRTPNTERSGAFTRDERGTLRRETAGGAEVTGRVARVDPSPSSSVDERALRAVQAAVGVLLLGAFVFRIPELVYRRHDRGRCRRVARYPRQPVARRVSRRRRAPPQVGAARPSRSPTCGRSTCSRRRSS